MGDSIPKILRQLDEIEQYWKTLLPRIPVPPRVRSVSWLQTYKQDAYKVAIEDASRMVPYDTITEQQLTDHLIAVMSYVRAKQIDKDHRVAGKRSYLSILELKGKSQYRISEERDGVLPEGSVLIHRLPARADVLRKAGIIVIEAIKVVGDKEYHVGWLVNQDWEGRYKEKLVDIFLDEQTDSAEEAII